MNETERQKREALVRAEGQQGPQDKRFAGPAPSGTGVLQDAVRRMDNEAKRVQGESESRQTSEAARRSQDDTLVDAASQQGLLRDPSDFLRRWRESGGKRGAEHLVALDAGNGLVEKRTDATHFHNTWSEYFDRIEIHNELFPETAISIEGVHDQRVAPEREEVEFLNDLNKEHFLSSSEINALAMFGGNQNYTDSRRAGAYLLTRQPYIQITKTPLSQDQISEFLAELNFFKVISYRHLEYYNPKVKVFLQDAHGGNIVSGTTPTGAEEIFLIDTPFRYATEGDAATIRAFNKMMRGKLINGKITREKYAQIKPFLTEFEEAPGALDGVRFSLESGTPFASENQPDYDTRREEEDVELRPNSTGNRIGPRTAQGYPPLENAPTVYGIKGGIPELIDTAEQYAEERQKRRALVRQEAARVNNPADVARRIALVREYSKTPLEERITRQNAFEVNLRAAVLRERQNAERLKDQQG
jgi:hypothetical protein